MSRNTHALQKQAAALLFSGYSANKVAENIGVRLSTVMRWRKAPRFIAHYTLLKSIKRQDMEIHMMLAAEKAIWTIEFGLDNRVGIGEASSVINTLKNIDKSRIFSEETSQNQPKKVQTSTPSVQTSLPSAEIDSN